MSPSFADVNVADCSLANTIRTRDAALRFTRREAYAYLGNLFKGELLAGDAAAVPVCVDEVLASRVVAEIGEAIVGRVAVIVTDLMPIWAGADEGQHDEAMNFFRTLLAVAAEVDHQVAASTPPGLQYTPNSGTTYTTTITPHPSVVAHGVDALIARYRAPFLIHGSS